MPKRTTPKEKIVSIIKTILEKENDVIKQHYTQHGNIKDITISGVITDEQAIDDELSGAYIAYNLDQIRNTLTLEEVAQSHQDQAYSQQIDQTRLLSKRKIIAILQQRLRIGKQNKVIDKTKNGITYGTVKSNSSKPNYIETCVRTLESLLRDESFVGDIRDARMQIGIGNSDIPDIVCKTYDDVIEAFLIELNYQCQNTVEYEKRTTFAIGNLSLHASRISSIHQLRDEWLKLIVAMIVIPDEIPDLEYIVNTISVNGGIDIVDIDEEGIVVKFRCGISGNEYKDSWKALKPFLCHEKSGQNFSSSISTLSGRIYNDYKSGMSIQDVGHKYGYMDEDLDDCDSQNKLFHIISDEKSRQYDDVKDDILHN